MLRRFAHDVEIRPILEEAQCPQKVLFVGNTLAFGVFRDEFPNFADDGSRSAAKINDVSFFLSARVLSLHRGASHDCRECA